MKKIVNLLLILLSFFIFSCANEPPVIDSPIYKIIIYQKGSLGIPVDSIFLSVFFYLDDDNGIEDITEINVIHLESELKWKIPLEMLTERYIWNDHGYYGYAFIEYENANSVLTGDYIIEVYDTAGNYNKVPFTVEITGVPLNKPFPIPDLKYKVEAIERKEIKISGDSFSAADIRVLTDKNIFNGGRKKFSNNQKILLANEPLPQNSILSIMISKDQEEKIVIFLKDLIM